MEGLRCLYGGADGSNINMMMNQRPPDAFFLSASSPSLLGSKSMVSLEDTKRKNQCGGFVLQSYNDNEIGDEDYDEYSQQPEKKRRLKADQIQFLEKSFETENKLEPGRKTQLAEDLDLQPRQVAIWFQNRRARFKTKNIERDYSVLQSNYNSLKVDYDHLLAKNEKLKAGVLDLTDKLLLKDKGNKLDLLDKQTVYEASQQERSSKEVSEGGVFINTVTTCKQEDHDSLRSDAVDLDSPHYSDGIYSGLMEPVDCTYIFEQDELDICQNEEDHLEKSLLLPLSYDSPKTRDGHYTDLTVNSSYFGFPVEEDHTFGFWGAES